MKTTPIIENIFEGKTALDSAKQVMGKIIRLPDFTKIQEHIGRIVQVTIFHEIDPKYDNSKLREGEKACFRIDAVEGVADSPGKLTKALGISKYTHDRISGLNIFANNLLYLMEDDLSAKITDEQIKKIKEKENNLVRKLKLIQPD